MSDITITVAGQGSTCVKTASPAPAALHEFATPGLHEEAFAFLERLYPRGCGPVLDLGGGTGAWSDRLLHHGFHDILAIDRDRAQFRGAAACIQGDLDGDFRQLLAGRKFQLITALEVIEHLENPTDFLRECAALLAPDGALMITTPNIESMPARIKFFAQGRLRHFDRNGDRTHITPIDTFLFDRLAARAGLKIYRQVPLVRGWHDRRLFFRVLAAALSPLAGGSPYGACHLFLLRAPRP